MATKRTINEVVNSQHFTANKRSKIVHDWVCSACEDGNVDASIKCHFCETWRENVWTCADCQNVNFTENTLCIYCDGDDTEDDIKRVFRQDIHQARPLIAILDPEQNAYSFILDDTESEKSEASEPQSIGASLALDSTQPDQTASFFEAQSIGVSLVLDSTQPDSYEDLGQTVVDESDGNSDANGSLLLNTAIADELSSNESNFEDDLLSNPINCANTMSQSSFDDDLV